MPRRIIAVLGVLALSVAFLPGAIGNLFAASVPDCCNGVMCPMHHMVDGHIVCDMESNQSGASLQSCPDNAQRYTVALTFVRLLPSVFFGERVVARTSIFELNVWPGAIHAVAPPPPRTSLA